MRGRWPSVPLPMFEGMEEVHFDKNIANLCTPESVGCPWILGDTFCKKLAKMESTEMAVSDMMRMRTFIDLERRMSLMDTSNARKQ